jgi:hypothetical protein
MARRPPPEAIEGIHLQILLQSLEERVAHLAWRGTEFLCKDHSLQLLA